MADTATPTIEQSTEGLQASRGLVSLYWDAKTGRLLLEIAGIDAELLYHWGLTTGVGSVDVGLDRGTVAGSALARWRRTGPTVLLELDNVRFRATGDNEALARSVRESFAPAVIAALPVVAEQDGRVLVDGTPLLIRDATGVARAVKRASLGDIKLDEKRSAPVAHSCKAFPRNTEIDVALTFSGDTVDPKLARLLVDGRTLTVRQHHSFMALPEPGYQPRQLDPRIGFNPLGFQDFAAAWDERLDKRWIRRWRLEKQHPDAALSPPKKPIVYYLDPAIPEPIREAMREGALWWNEAFEAAGFIDAFQVLDLPDDADPLDARYSVIQWVHRADRGWSVGASWSDPRTGEILCGRPRMDSHRVRTVYNYWRAAVPEPDELHCCSTADPAGDLALTIGALDDSEAVMLRRIALLTAHEVGHTLGLPHNFGASLYGRGSVMEYFTPRIGVRDDGTLDLSDAYMHGLGAWDIQVIRWGYSELPPQREAEELERIVREGLERGIHFLPASDPRWNPYDDGSDTLAWLGETMASRRALLQTFGPTHLRRGEPVADLDARLGLVYLFHRYAIEAAVKLVGGMEHTNAIIGDGQLPTTIVPGDRQRQALELLLTAVTPSELEIPERILEMLPPAPYGSGRSFDASTARAGYAFDQLAAARTLTALVVDGLLDKDRCARLVALAARDPSVPDVDEILSTLVERTWTKPPAGAVRLVQVVQRALVDRLMQLASADGVSPEVRASVLAALRAVQLLAVSGTGPHHDAVAHDVSRFLEQPKDWTPKATAIGPPPGPPV